MLFQNGVMGLPTWASREGLNFDQEQEDLRRYGGPPAGAGPKQPAGDPRASGQDQTPGVAVVPASTANGQGVPHA
jgi:hypothetical protein